MWSNLKSIASDAIEAAIDIKQHIAEVTHEDLEALIEQPAEEIKSTEYIDSIVSENCTLKSELAEVTKVRTQEKSAWKHEKRQLEDAVRTLEAALAEKEKENVWDTDNLKTSLQELMKAKNKALRELEKVTQELEQVRKSSLQKEYSSEKLSLLNEKVEKLVIEKKQVLEERDEWRRRYENHAESEVDKVSRSFFIQFVSAFQRNVYNVKERDDMLMSLVGILHLNDEEKALLGIEITAPASEESSLFDKFTSFLSGMNSK